VRQIRSTLNAFRQQPDFAHWAAAQQAYQEWDDVPLTPKAGAYVDCFGLLVDAESGASMIYGNSTAATDYAQVPDRKVRAQLQASRRQVQATSQATFDTALQKASNCIDSADGVPPQSTSPLRAQAAISVFGGRGRRGGEQFRIALPASANGTIRQQQGQPFNFALKHKKGSPYTYKSGTGRVVSSTDGVPHLFVTSLIRTDGQTSPVRGVQPTMIVPATNTGNAAVRSAALNALRNARKSALQPYLQAMDDAINRVPGLSQILQSGSAASQRTVDAIDAALQTASSESTRARDEIYNQYNPAASPYMGLRLIRDTLVGEGTARVVSAGGRAILSASVERLGSLLAVTPSAARVKLAGEVAQVEAREQAAVTKAVSAAAAKIDSKLGERLAKAFQLQSSTVKRAVNPVVNQIVYELEVIARAGGNPAQELSTELTKQGYTGLQKTLTQNALLQNWRAARELNAFTDQNLELMRVGRSAILANGQVLTVDHTVPLQALPNNQELLRLGNTLANLHYLAGLPNSWFQNTVTEGSYYYARLLQQAGYMSQETLTGLEQKIRYVAKPRRGQ